MKRYRYLCICKANKPDCQYACLCRIVSAKFPLRRVPKLCCLNNELLHSRDFSRELGGSEI